MKFILSILCVIVLAYVFQMFGPWWIASLASIIVYGLFTFKSPKSALGGFLAVAILWAIQCLWIDMNNNHLLSAKIGALFGSLSSPLVILVAVLLGGLLGALSAAVGALMRQVFFQKT